MMTTRKPKSANRRKSPPIQYCTYLLEVLDRKVRYSFSTNRDCDRVRTPGPYTEYAAIEINGKLILPEKHAETIVECIVYGRRDYDEFISKPDDFDKIQSGSVGIINIRKDYSSFYGWVPFSAFPMIANMLATEDFKYLQMYGTPLKYRAASIVSLDLRKDYNPEDC